MELLPILQKGKIPPQSIDLEENVLGAMLIDKESIMIASDILDTSHFYKESHSIIFDAILELYRNSLPVDLSTVSEKLRKLEQLDLIGGDYTLIQLTQKVASSAHIEYHARIIIEKYVKRELISVGSELVDDGYSQDDVFDLIDRGYDKLNKLTENSFRQQEVTFKDTIKSVIERGIKIYQGEIKAGLETPIEELTSKTGGWRDSELIILAARPGMGKTAFALSCALKSAKDNIPTAFFSLEMSREQLTSRMLSMKSKIDNKHFNITGLSQDDFDKLMTNDLTDIDIYIDDTASLTIEQLQIKAKRLKNLYGIKFIVIDYLQLMSGNGQSREQEISKISRGIKKIAKDLNIPILALSQLSRAVEQRGGMKRPMLSDLRESGAIEQDADMVGFLFRPEYYGILEWDDDTHESSVDQAEIIIAKNRNGALAIVRTKFEGRYTLFSDLETIEQDEPF